jgi:phosphoribosylglycinamide formyltransferase-1
MRTAVLISGSGSNLQALIDAAQAPDYPAKIVLVIANKADAYGLIRAQNAGIATLVLSHQDYPSREAYDLALTEALEAMNIECVCLAGFMRLLTPGFVKHWHNRLINIHPSLLPAFKGLHTHQAALDAGVKFAGCTVHFVREEMDAGPIIAQAVVDVLDDDTADTLAARVLTQEHRLYPQVLRWFAEGRLTIEGNRVHIQ